jgi:uncharacterized LabA/DUF88 family protein
MPAKNQRVAVFIDHSNVCHRLAEMKKVDPLWQRWYDPLKLARRLVGKRELVGVHFYCAPPPPYLLQEPGKEKIYWKQMSYYEEIKKLDKVVLKYSRLSGVKGDLHEKNLDTQLNTDLLVMATQNTYDTAIVISNDGDYESAFQGVKDLGRKVELVYFRYKVSWNLKRIADISRKARRSFFEKLNFDVNNPGVNGN